MGTNRTYQTMTNKEVTKMEPKHDHPSEAEENAIAFRVVALLQGLPITTAMTILEKTARNFILDGHRVDITNPRFQGLRSAVDGS